MKTCKKCKEKKGETDFYMRSNLTRDNVCKDCRKDAIAKRKAPDWFNCVYLGDEVKYPV